MESVDRNLRPYMQLRACIDGVLLFILPTIWLGISYFYDLSFKLSVIIYIVLALFYIIFVVVLRPIVYTRITKIGVYDDYLVVRKGFFFIETSLYPIERVQIVEVEKGFVARRFNLAEIQLTTAGDSIKLPKIETTRAFNISSAIISRVKEVDSDV